MRFVQTSGLVAFVITTVLFFGGLMPIYAQPQDELTYPELNTALQTRLPNQSFRNKTELISWLITQIRRRKMDKPLTKDREDDLRQAGATDELIAVVRSNSPPAAVPTPTPAPTPAVVDLGELLSRAVDLVRPEYTDAARQAGTAGEVKLALELDETGAVTSVTPLTVLPHGLTDQAVRAARRTRFRPAQFNGRPARGRGVMTYNFRINVVNTSAVLAAADQLRAEKDCDRAIVAYNQVIGVDASNAGAMFGRGTCYLMKGDFDRALADLGKAVELDPQGTQSHVNLAIVRDFKGDIAGAASAYSRALAISPDLDKQPLFTCLFIDRPGLTPESARSAAGGIINACTRELRSAEGPLAGLIQYKRGIGHRLRADYDKAIADLVQVKRANPNFSAVNSQLQIVYNSRGLEAFNKKNYRQAFDDVTLAIQADPQNPTPYINRCAINLYAWKQYSEAVNDCTAAIRLTDRSSTAYSHRGYAYEMLNNRNEAIADYRKALDIDPRNEAARTNLARLDPRPPTMRDNR
ncbi:MAG: TonB family protein [Pyrinomonadaceae bacterium]